MENVERATIEARKVANTRSASSPARRARSQRNYAVSAQNEKTGFAETKKDGQVRPNYNEDDRVELHSKDMIENARRLASESFKTELFGSSWSRGEIAYDYEISKFNDLVVKIVKQEDRSEVVRQYPTKGQMTYKNAFRKFMELIGL